MDKLLLEIGAEEIPAGYIKPALQAMAANLDKKLTAARIDHGAIATYGTPRRLSVMAEAVAPRQKSVSNEVMGPPAKIGYDADGAPTMAAEKFAQKLGVSVKRLKVKQTAKGSYLYAVVSDRGLATKTLLKRILPELILEIPFPKTMRWADLQIQFARPILYLTALLGSQAVVFNLESIRSSRYTRGHSFMHPARIKLAHPDEYVTTLRSADVIVDMAQRRQAVKQAVEQAAAQKGGQVLADEELLDTVTNLVEIPIATAGRFEDDFLSLPQEILITAMREHQKYFAVVDQNDGLMPCFIAVNNTRTRDLDLVATGHERVLRARLADAKFFYESDSKVSFDTWSQKLKGVLFQSRLGSMHDKVLRVRTIVDFLARKANRDETFVAEAKRAASLCKTDLVSQVVVEFPKLQGVMGRVYANARREPPAVAVAIEEHYRPTRSGGDLPQTMTGAILAIADKIDTICGCFSVGLVPTGASDPYALRRQGIGIVNIMRDKDLALSLKDLIHRSLSLFDVDDSRQRDTVVEGVYTFIKNRMARLLVEEGYARDLVAAVIDADAENVPDVWQRVAALQQMKGASDFEALVTAFKRVVNIIRKAADEDQTSIDKRLFEAPAESALWESYHRVKDRVVDHLRNGRYEAVLVDIGSLRGPIDGFFEDVLVMAEDPAVRRNRLTLLAQIAGLFATFADFSKIST